jgi:hypothetical protein
MRNQRNLLVGTSRVKDAPGAQASKADGHTSAGWRYMLVRPFIPAGPASAVAMTPLLTRETA